MRVLAVLLLASCFVSAQSAKSHVPAVTQCRADLAAANSSENALMDGFRVELAKNAKLEADSAELTAKNAELAKKLEDSRAATVEAVKTTQKLQEAYAKSIDDRNEIADKFNNALQQMRREVNAQNERISDDSRRARWLAAYSTIPRAQPYMLPPPVVPVMNAPHIPYSTGINCTSMQVGQTVSTNCN